MIKLPKTKVRNFEYNGFMGRMLKGYAKFKVVSFIEWTTDPGIGKFGCSDGKERLIPSFAFIKCLKKLEGVIPEQPKENLVMFGAPSGSKSDVDFLGLFR